MKRWTIPGLAALCLAASVLFIASRHGAAPSAAAPAASLSRSPSSGDASPARAPSSRTAASSSPAPRAQAITQDEAELPASAATRIAADPAARRRTPSAAAPSHDTAQHRTAAHDAARSASGGAPSASAAGIADANAAPPVQELAALPVVFQLDPGNYINLGSGEDAIIAEGQQQFSDAMAGAGDPDSAEYLKRWNRARWNADNLLRQQLGAEGFNRLNFLSAGADAPSEVK